MNLFYSFLAGLFSFFSPCLLPLLPSYLVYIGNISSFSTFQSEKKSLIYHTLFFIAGFSSVFASFGALGSLIGKLLIGYKTYILIIGGTVLVIFGLFTMGLLNLPFLVRQIGIDLKERPQGLAGSFLVGITFGLGWSPCIGPALSSVLFLSLTSEKTSEAVIPPLFYSLGLGVPFFVSALLVDVLLKHFAKIGTFAKYGKLILGFLLIVIGVALITGHYVELTLRLSKLQRFF